MAEMKKKHVFKTKSEIISGEVMFQRLLAINAYKKIPLERVFSFENTMVPLSMFTEQGQMHKSKKSDFMSKLEDLLPGNTATIENADTVIFDGMAVIQLLQVQSAENTFLDMAAFFLKYILMKARAIPGVKYVHIVFDKYKKLSPKSDTRRDRGDIAATNIHINSDLRVPKDWKQFLCSGTNKERLAEYYTGYIKEKASCHLKAHEILFINGGNDEICLKVNTDDCTEIQALKSNQEEADTLMILHAKYAVDTGSSSIVIQSPDTDELVLLIHHHKSIGAKYLYMSTGRVNAHTDHRRYIPVHDLVQRLGGEEIKIILTVYCLTGCDTTSSFFGKGKKTVFKQMMQYPGKYQQLHNVGESINLSRIQKMACTKFVVNLYGGRDTQSLNDVRCKMAMQSKHPRSLPPTENSFSEHCLRCLLQLWIWRHATTAIHDLPPLVNFGYDINEECSIIRPTQMTQSPAAPELLNDLTCECPSCNETCSCFANQQPCTMACSCTSNLKTDDLTCTNIYTLSAVFSNEDFSSDED